MEQTPETELRPIYKPTSKYNLQDALGLKNEKQRWLAYLEIMRECLYEKNDRPPPSPQAQQDPPSPVEPSDEQVQIWPPVEPSDEQVQIRPPEPRTDEQVQMVHKRSQNKLQERKNKSFSNNKRKRDKVNSLNETIENKDKEITQLKRQKTFAVELYQQKLNQNNRNRK
ncbi:hypothetical protein GLOIN_2v1480211 [Rhizophagus irregularis DAOM 181602=DAOM 197198]|nr:hypothetical protein GLOIN_2v1480211 [Rhizophagus irregularis DAOM 181602=DAOM 197198]